MELMGLFLFTQLYRLNPEENGCAEVCLTCAEDPAPRAEHRSCSALKKAGALKFASLALNIPRRALNIARAPLKIPALALNKTGALKFVSLALKFASLALNFPRLRG